MFTITEVIDLAIQIEKNGERVYRQAMEKIANPALVSLLQRLADEEAAHARWFQELKAKLKAAEADPQLAQTGKEILGSILGEQGFSLDEADFSQISQVTELLSLATEFEKDTILFYGMIGSLLDDKDTLRYLEKIIEEENQHVQGLANSLQHIPEHH